MNKGTNVTKRKVDKEARKEKVGEEKEERKEQAKKEKVGEEKEESKEQRKE